ncbi:cardiolipin synthase [Bacillus taeanensis]|uniref:Cardiolipin synthase n=1 Tax=Bacillus taeanensis TaxID=273032 RepID=A0A366Y0L6_9BACI|nr:cardiolipin synthase [Bacillus taeanensis]RBW69943.1 cardiolipin synthase [Bacillus taeanensis]
MKNRIQVIAVLGVITAIMFIIKPYWENWLLGGLSILFSVTAFFIAFLIFLENRHPSKTITWLIVLVVFPVVGFIIYILFGQSYRRRRMFREKAVQDEQAFMEFEGNRLVDEEKMGNMGDHQQLLFRLAHHLGKSPISFDTNTEVLTNGKETFNKIIEQLKKAKHHIHLEYYIVRDDELGNHIKTILMEKAKEGVEVRFLYDAVGSLKLSKHYIKELREAGVKTVPFLPVRIPLLNNKINFRNHRKIVVVDGVYGFVGGLNIGDEYLGKNKYFGFWRDTHLLVEGEAVRTLQLIFLLDWFYMTDEKLLTAEYLSPKKIANDDQSDSLGGVQMIASGPDHEWEIIKHLFFSMIVSAKKSIWIASPYFIPDDDILTALKVASLSGIDVRLLVPARPDKRIVFYASRSYFPELLEAGVKIYAYQKGFMHSKIMIVDEELASIGTSNMDMRSFHLNFEVNAFLYRTVSTRTLVQDYENDLTVSKEIHINDFKQRSLFQRIVESLSRLLSPIL